MHEEVLSGGNINIVSRVGDSIRRPAGFWTPNVHALLKYVNARGFSKAPQPLGIDEHGREILTLFPGHTGTYPDGWPWTTDEFLTQIGRMLRELHTATTGFVAPEEGWRFQVGAPREGSVICHNDFAPYNMLFEHDEPVGLIDWDFAAPAPPEWDVAHALWRFIPLYPPERWWLGDLADLALERRARRFRLLCEGYGIAPTVALLDVVEERQRVVFRTTRDWAKAGEPGFIQLWNGAESEDGFAELAYLKDIKRDLGSHLDR
jgi:hypothetical protein